ncbi:hypothetical protein, partial [Sporisorium scitamineum]
MSDLQRSFVKSKLSKLPPVPAFSEADEDGIEQEAELSSTAIPRLGKRKQQADDFSPRTAEGCFEQALEVDVLLDSGKALFRVYYTPLRPKAAAQTTASAPTPSKAKQPPPASLHNLEVEVNSPALPTLRPGVGLPTDDGDEDDDATPLPQGATPNPGTLFVFHHGAGFSALSYALTAAEITKLSGGEVGVLAYDCRGHGRTRLQGVKTDPLDMSIDVLSADLIALLSTMFPRTEEMPSLVL